MRGPEDLHFTHHEMVVLSVFTQSILQLHAALAYEDEEAVARATRAAIRCARMFTLKEDYK